MSTLRVAAVQAGSVFLDRDATVDKACGLIDKAAGDGAGLVVLPESLVPAFPDWMWLAPPWDGRTTALWTRLVDQALVVDSDATRRIGAAAKRAAAWVSIGATEREPNGSTLYSAQLLFGPDGELRHRHRKMMPTGGERLVWGQGDGSSLRGVDTDFGRLGTLLCWENLMPLARAALYADGIDIHLAPTWDMDDAWLATLRHTAREGRVFVVGVNQYVNGSEILEHAPELRDLYGNEGWTHEGNTTIVGPDGSVVAGPLVGEEGIVLADIDVAEARAARHQNDPVGHYARSDVLTLVVDRRERRSVTDLG